MLDEGRMLRRQIEVVSADLDVPRAREANDELGVKEANGELGIKEGPPGRRDPRRKTKG
jgi:hypothetical protein